MRLDNITKFYGEKRVFSGFTAYFPNGQTTWLTGDSGAGKTTLLRIIAGLEVFEGSITDTPSENAAFVFQEDRLLTWLSALENCYLAARGKPVFDVREALLMTGLTEDEICRPMSGLSGGQKRRAAIVRALVPSTGLILMDEPFKGLDEESKAKTAAAVKHFASGRTIIASTHDPDAIKLIPGGILDISPK